MIHSMSGGVLGDLDSLTFVKVKFDGGDAVYWYVTDFEVEEGDRVTAPFGASGVNKPATVVKVECNVSNQVSPIPVKRAKKLTAKL